VSRSRFVTYEQDGRATHRVSASGHRIEVACRPWERRLGAGALFVAANYGLIALDYFRRSDLDFEAVFILAFSLVLIPLGWLGAMTFWYRFRVDIDRGTITVRARTLVPRERVVVCPLGDFVNVTWSLAGVGPRLFFDFASRPGQMTPMLWVSRDQLVGLREWISSAAAEMVAAGAPVFAARADDGAAAASMASTNLGAGMAPWPPPPRALSLRQRVQMAVDGWVLLWSVLLMTFAPASASALFATDVTSPWLFAGPRARTTALIESCEKTDFRVHEGIRVRRVSYRFDAGGVTWRSSSFNDRRYCPEIGTIFLVEYPLGLPSLSRLRDMSRHPLTPDFGPLLVAIFLYALGELAATFLAAAGEMRFLSEGRITLAIFDRMIPVNASSGKSLLVYRLLAGSREVTSARFSYGPPDPSEQTQLVLYDPRRPGRREFTAHMGSKNLSTVGGLDKKSIGGTLFIGVALELALLLVYRAIHWTVVHYL